MQFDETATHEALLPQRPTTLTSGLSVHTAKFGSPSGCKIIPKLIDGAKYDRINKKTITLTAQTEVDFTSSSPSHNGNKYSYVVIVPYSKQFLNKKNLPQAPVRPNIRSQRELRCPHAGAQV